MAEPFKNVFNPSVIRLMGTHLDRAGAGLESNFDKARFVKIATHKLDSLEFMQRCNQITAALEATLPNNFRRACELMRASLHSDRNFTLADMSMDEHGIRGWAVMPMADYVARQGLEDFDFSMRVLKTLTRLSSSEFAVRAFLISDTERALLHVRKWARDKDYHVRRLASEGTRPRLPWGIRLPMLVTDPKPILPILEALRDDPEEYVRRSVANNLNDIAKDHPDKVAKIAREWLKDADLNRSRLVKHACRTLVKQGHKPTLKALGFKTPKIHLRELSILTPKVKLGGHLQFTLEIASKAKQKQSLVVDYIIHHQKANGQTSPKVFKLKTVELPAGEQLRISRNHAIKPITTRKYHAGQHRLEVQVNGDSFGSLEFQLAL